MAFGKWVKRKSRQATKAAGKRYGISYGRKGVQFKKNTMSKLAKDVMMIKSQLNVEKKYVDTAESINGNVGQVRDNGDGYFAEVISPDIVQGVAEGQRVGNSIKATGLVLKFNMFKQPQAEGNRRLCIRVIKSLDPGMSPAEIHAKLLDVNPFVPVRDYNSNLDYTQLKDGRIKVIAEKKVYFGQNGGDGLGTIPAETMTKSVTLPIKLDEVHRFSTNAQTQSDNIRYYLVITCDNGNAGGSSSSILGAYVTNPNSGIDFKCHSRFWYVDN